MIRSFSLDNCVPTWPSDISPVGHSALDWGVSHSKLLAPKKPIISQATPHLICRKAEGTPVWECDELDVWVYLPRSRMRVYRCFYCFNSSERKCFSATNTACFNNFNSRFLWLDFANEHCDWACTYLLRARAEHRFNIYSADAVRYLWYELSYNVFLDPLVFIRKYDYILS